MTHRRGDALINARYTCAMCRVLLRILLAGLAITAACGHAAPPPSTSPPAFTRQQAREIIADSRKIVSPRGIQVLTQIPVHGTQQWISVRGNDARNPILLFLHGGPASPDMPLSYTFQGAWEDYFTVVQWDQRGAGKTYAANDPAQIGPTITIDQMIADAEAVIQYLQTTYHKQKIFLLGHSWGSVLGVQLAQRHPAWLHGYLGVGQIVDMRRSEQLGYEFALREARKDHNAEAIRALEAIAPYPGPGGELELAKLDVQRRWLMYYGGLTWGRRDFRHDARAWSLAPEYTDADLAAIDRGSALSLARLLAPLAAVDFTRTTQFRCPIFLFLGRHDFAVSQDVAAQWFATLRAPAKRLVWFEDSAHMVMQEQAGRFLVHLVEDVRPLAVEAGDAAPDDQVAEPRRFLSRSMNR
jgi:pimeloyl-ACP methyl ester carboxylesterase